MVWFYNRINTCKLDVYLLFDIKFASLRCVPETIIISRNIGVMYRLFRFVFHVVDSSNSKNWRTLKWALLYIVSMEQKNRVQYIFFFFIVFFANYE